MIILIPTKLFLDLYLTKFLDTSTKPFFPCMIYSTSKIDRYGFFDYTNEIANYYVSWKLNSKRRR